MKEDRRSVRAGYVAFLRGDQGSEEVLLGLRHNTGYLDGHWGLPAGHIQYGELPLAGAVREIYEELGVVVEPSDLSLFAVGNRLGNNADGDRVDFYFVCRKWQGDFQNMEPSKCQSLEWHPLRYLPADSLMPYLEQPLSRLVDTSLSPYIEE